MGATGERQLHFKLGVNVVGVTDPDSVIFGALDTDIIAQPKNTPFHVRIQVINVAKTTSTPWQLYYNTISSVSGSIPVTTSTSVVKIVDDPNIADATATDVSDTVFDSSGTYTWINGLFIDESDETPSFLLGETRYTDFQFNIQFDDTAVAGQDYHFFIMKNDVQLSDGYSQLPTVTIADDDPESTIIYDNGLVQVDIYILEDEIDDTDYIRIYEVDTDVNPSDEVITNSVLTLKSGAPVFDVTDPSTDDYYRFSGTIRLDINDQPGTKTYYYIIYDELGNEGTISDEFEVLVCLVPRTVALSNPVVATSTLTFDLGFK